MDILLITHAADRLRRWRLTRYEDNYMIAPVLRALADMGHRIMLQRGLPARPVKADLAVMHVDLTVVPPAYVEFGAQFPRCLNLRATDISKRKVSGARLLPGEAWDGPVMVKSDLNWHGFREMRLAKRAAGHGLRAERLPGAVPEYAIYDSLSQVPVSAMDDQALVVEKFLPERHGDLYVTRFWTFSGDQERCTRVFSRSPEVKASNEVGFELCDVPDALRQRRKELGFGYGKFDFVLHDGAPVLLDANKTPGAPPANRAPHWPAAYANGLLRWAESGED